MRKNEVIQLTEIEHVLQRSGMYLGDTSLSNHSKYHINGAGKIVKGDIRYCPAVIKLFDEIISNSIDEALRTGYKYANKININIKGNTIKVADNGRGIPIVIDKQRGKTQAEMAFTSLRAGGNFINDSFVSIGTHGLGSTLVNIMSTVFRAETNDGKKKFNLVSSDNMSSSKVKITKSRGMKYCGTSVEFTPDFTRFAKTLNGLDSVHMGLIEKRLSDLAVCFPDIAFKLNNKTIRLKSFKKYAELYSDDVLIQQSENFKLAIFPVDEPSHVSFVNGIDTYEGGTHVRVAMNKLIEGMLVHFNKRFKKLKITPADIRNHLGIILISDKINNPKFRSQTKEYISNPSSEFKKLFTELGNASFIRKVLKNDNIIDPIIETKKLKSEAAERVAIKRAQRTQKRVRVASYIPANSKRPKDKVLFITEGASAIGQLCNVRDPAIHSGFPLKGKVLNISGKKPTEILKNEELKNLMAIIGLNIGAAPIGLNIGKINILADADYDGLSICGLLINFFHLWPDLFDGRLNIVKSPILIATKGKQIKRFYSLNDFDQKKYNGWNIKYFKGLGGLPESEYELMINDPILEKVVLDEDAEESLNIAFGNDSQKRKDWLSK